MPKKPEEYAPSPWLKEDLRKEQVRVPPAIVGALYRLQQDKKEVEYGGAIDFELLRGKPVVERVLSYTGLVRSIPPETWQKVFQNPDIELTFHTHPGQNLAVPSEGDIIFFLTTEPGAMLIFATDEAILMAKGIQTPPAEFARDHMGEYQETARRTTLARVISKPEQDKMRKDLKKELDIDTVVFPVEKPMDITLKIVQDIAREGLRPQIFK